MLGCLAAMCVTFTSCNDDDDNSSKSLTPTEKQTAYNAIKGDYTGKLIYGAVNAKNSKDITDTIAATWHIATDSTVVIDKFPTKLLADNITDDNIKAALTAADAQNITCYTNYFRVSPAAFWANPVTPSYNLTYGGAAHKVQIAFFINSTYSFGQLDAKGNFEMQIIEGGIYVDGKLTTNLKANTPFMFIAEKK